MAHWTLVEPGDLTFENVSSARVRLIEGEVNITASRSGARLEVHDLQGELDVSLHDGELEIAHPDLTWGGLLSFRPRRDRRRAAISLAIPADAALRLGVVSATAVVTGLAAPTAVRSVSGDVTLDGITGEVAVESVSGSLEALAITGAVDFTTVSGALTLADGTCAQVRTKTVSGDVTLDLTLAAGGDVRADTVSGDVLVRLADPIDAMVEITSVSGRLESAEDGLDDSRSPGRHRMRGSLGDGSGQVRVNTVSGDVSLLTGRAREGGAEVSPVFGHGALRLYLLKLLDEQPRHGYDLMRELEDRFLGLYTPSAGTIYPRLARLQADGLVVSQAEDGGRRTFELTDAGRAELIERSAELDSVEAEVAGSARAIAREVRNEVRTSVRELREELSQAAREARRTARRSGRPEPALGREVRRLERELTAFTADVLAAAAGRRLDHDRVDEVNAALRRARIEVLAALGERPRHRRQ